MVSRDYDSNEWQTMRQEAIRQAREMQEKAGKQPKQAKESPLPPTTLWDRLGIDEERAFLLLLILLLSREGADQKLLLALCYLLL